MNLVYAAANLSPGVTQICVIVCMVFEIKYIYIYIGRCDYYNIFRVDRYKRLLYYELVVDYITLFYHTDSHMNYNLIRTVNKNRMTIDIIANI